MGSYRDYIGSYRVVDGSEWIDRNGEMIKYEIRDWMNNSMFNGQAFESFESAWDHIYQNVEDEDHAYDEYFVVEIIPS